MGRRHHRNDCAGIDAAGQESAQRYIRHETQIHSRADALDQFLLQVVHIGRDGGIAGRWQPPIALEQRGLATFADHEMRRRQPFDASECGICAANVAEAQEIVKSLGIGLAANPGPAQDGLDFRSE